MNIIFIIAGGSFRKGSRGNKNFGSENSYDEQIKASKSHIAFLEHIKKKYNLTISIIISTYSTKYNNDLINIYNDYIVDINIFKYNNENDLIGIHRMFHESYKDHLKNYDAMFFFRIDIVLKQKLFDIFDPNSQKILFPFICSKINILNGHIDDRYPSGHPKHSDILLFIPKKYFYIINHIDLGHWTWEKLVVGSGRKNRKNILRYDDLDCMIYTYHDSNSENDWNPLYYIVNREQACFESWNDCGIFDKKNYNYI